MKWMKRVLIPLSAVAVLIALMIESRSYAQEPSQKNAAQKTTSDKDVIIGYLQSRTSVVTIIRGPKGTVYTVKSKSGKTLATKLGEKELQAKYPAIYDQVKHGLAGNDASIRK